MSLRLLKRLNLADSLQEGSGRHKNCKFKYGPFINFNLLGISLLISNFLVSFRLFLQRFPAQFFWILNSSENQERHWAPVDWPDWILQMNLKDESCRWILKMNPVNECYRWMLKISEPNAFEKVCCYSLGSLESKILNLKTGNKFSLPSTALNKNALHKNPTQISPHCWTGKANNL